MYVVPMLLRSGWRPNIGVTRLLTGSTPNRFLSSNCNGGILLEASQCACQRLHQFKLIVEHPKSLQRDFGKRSSQSNGNLISASNNYSETG